MAVILSEARDLHVQIPRLARYDNVREPSSSAVKASCCSRETTVARLTYGAAAGAGIGIAWFLGANNLVGWRF